MRKRLLLLALLGAGQIRPAMNDQTPNIHDALAIEYRLLSTAVTLHEPILMRVTISNPLDTVARVNLGQDRKQAFELSIGKPDGKIVSSNLPLHEGASRLPVVEVASGDTYTEILVLNQWYPFPEVGTYTVKVRLTRVLGSQEDLPDDFGSWSALPPVDVIPRDPARLTAVCDQLKTKLETSKIYAELGEAAFELSYVDDPVAVPYLQDMALLKSGMLAPLAAEGLERVDGNAGVDALIALSKESTVEIRSPARYSLWQLEQTTKDPALRERIKQALVDR